MFRYGTSWRGRRPGTRHWVSGPLLLWLIYWAIAGCIWLVLEFLYWSVVSTVWLGAESVVILWAAGRVIVQLCQRQRLDWRHVYWVRLPMYLWDFRVPGNRTAPEGVDSSEGSVPEQTPERLGRSACTGDSL